MDSMANESVSSFCVRCWISGRIAEIVTYFSADTCTVTSLKKASEPSTLPPAACTSCLLGEDPFASSRSRCHRWAFAAPLHAQPCHVWSSTECPLPESAYVLAFQVLCFAWRTCAARDDLRKNVTSQEQRATAVSTWRCFNPAFTRKLIVWNLELWLKLFHHVRTENQLLVPH